MPKYIEGLEPVTQAAVADGNTLINRRGDYVDTNGFVHDSSGKHIYASAYRTGKGEIALKRDTVSGYDPVEVVDLVKTIIAAKLPVEAYVIEDATKEYIRGEGRKTPYSVTELVALVKGQELTLVWPNWGYGKPKIRVGNVVSPAKLRTAKPSNRIGK